MAQQHFSTNDMLDQGREIARAIEMGRLSLVIPSGKGDVPVAELLPDEKSVDYIIASHVDD